MNALVQYQRRSLAVLLLLCLQLLAKAQPAASFTATPQNGCSPLIVHFTDASTGNPTQWKWDLGNGAVSTLQHPSATYFNPGTYSVKLVVKNSSGADSIVKQQYITVYAAPLVSFGASDTAGCFPLTVHFSDSSSAGSGSISSWQWDFGDGTIASQQHPSHTYTASGNYTVTLKVTNSFGCVKTFTRSQYIKLSAGVTAAFDFSAASLCTAPANIQFNNNSTGPGNLSYQWNFGDGGVSSAASPLHAYNTNGTYAVTLIATSVQGCSDTATLSTPLSLGQQQAGFSAPLAACVGQPITLTNTSTPQPLSTQWSFSDGTNASTLNTTKTFAAPGTYTVKMVASFGGCADSLTRTITVATVPVAAFTANATQFCKTPATVQFSSANTGTLLWIFGDGQTSNAANPQHTYTAEGEYTVKLVVTNAAGCSDTVVRSQYVQIKKPVVQLAGLPVTGCAPQTAAPTATVVSSEPVQTWSWNFGDGNFSNSATPSHTYTGAGNYNVSLKITTASGCTDSVTLVDGVRLGIKPHANFGALPPQVCNVYPVQFIDSSTGNPDQWFWDFHDNSTSNEQNPSHVFGDIGIYSVTLIAFNNTCADTITKVNVVTVLPPISAFTVQHSCTSKYVKQFTDASYGATSWLWNFGDGNSSTAQNPSHTYSATGTYFVTLTVSNGSCWNVNNMWVKVVDEAPALLDNDVVCRNVADTFQAPVTNMANIAAWSWTFSDGFTSTQPAPIVRHFTSTGPVIVTMTLTDVLGCVETKTDTVQVFGPTAAFIPSATAACFAGNHIGFSDGSMSDGQHPLQQWTWSYGDGTIHSTTAPMSASHNYSNPGQYTVKLVVKDAYGCQDSTIFSPLVIAQPVAAFQSPDSLSCTGKTVHFVNNSTGDGLQYAWNLGDNASSQDAQPDHQYGAIGTYNVSLHITDQYGCTDSLVRPSYVVISLPKAAFTVSDSLGTCPPLMVHFTNGSTGYTQLAWDFGDGSASTLANPSHYYNTAGTFFARLVVTGPGGCTDTAYHKIVVKGPSGSFSYAPLQGCNPLTVNFSLQAINASSFVWDFSDGNTLPSTVTTASHGYTTPGDYVPKLILADTAGCSVPVMGTDTIHVYDVTAAFEPNNPTLCDAGMVQFTNSSVANDYITSYQWSFGDGSHSNGVTPQHQYAGIGQYDVQLIATTANGCTDTVLLSNAVTVLEKPDVTITGNSSFCVPALAAFGGSIQKGDSATLSWQWDFGNNQTANTQYPAAQPFATDGDYTIRAIVTAQNGCKDTAAHQVTVHPLPATNAGADAAICRGSSLQLSATGAASYAWNAEPSLSCTGCAAPLASPTDSTTYVVTGTSAFGCIRKDSVTLLVHQPFLLQAGVGDTICIGGKVSLTASGADQYSWYPASGVQNPSAAATAATPTSTLTYHVIGTDAHHCFTDTADVFIKVWPLPTVNAGIDQQLVVGDALQLTATGSPDVVSWQWNNAGTLSCPACPLTAAKPKQTTTYTVTVQNGGGCTASDNVTVTVICNNGNLFIPNTFSPNGDGMNDRFYPSGKGINAIRSLRVYNRWGQVVFEKLSFSANDASAGWDGTFKGQVLPPDVYVYACEVVCQNNEVLSYKGDVTLLR